MEHEAGTSATRPAAHLSGDSLTSAERPLRIAHLIWQFPVLSATFSINEIGGAITRGHDVTVLPFARAMPAPVFHPDVDRLDMRRRVVSLALPRGFGKVPALAKLVWRAACGRRNARVRRPGTRRRTRRE